MLDIELIRREPEKIISSLKKRNMDVEIIYEILTLDKLKRETITNIEKMRAERNKLADELSRLDKTSELFGSLSREAEDLREKIKTDELQLKEIEKKLNDLLLTIPNIPDESVPVGKDETENRVIYQSGEIKRYNFDVKPHWEIGERLGILDFKTASKISGSRFALIRGLGAKLERALINFMLDVHINERNYTEVFAPYMVKREIMQGTGQLPKFEIELYRCRDDDLYLIPTAEVSVTNIHKDEIIPEEELPMKYVSYSACFRREAGSYGKDTKGLIRNHQFNKVELVKFVKPEDSETEFQSLVEDAVEILKKLGLVYRIVAVCTGDLGFASAKTYDIEVWMPGEGRWREVSSCSNFKDFQARRINIKLKRKSGKKDYIHTLNGSGLAIGRTFAAILENYQTEDGKIIIPEVLKNYMKCEIIG